MTIRKLQQLEGYSGIWYYNQELPSIYKYKYSGGLGTYCAKHIPMAVFSKEENKTFFVYGASQPMKCNLLHAISYFNHDTGTVPRPRCLLDKKTRDAHDNPVISMDDEGFIWIFSSSHGVNRPSYIHVSEQPNSIDSFQLVKTTNFSYPQPWFIPDKGFMFLFTKYYNGRRFLSWSKSIDGNTWTEEEWLGGVERGHYQVSGRSGEKVGTAFNFHPEAGGLNHRTNLYYVETPDLGKTWTNIAGKQVDVPLLEINNPALVMDYKTHGLLVYMKDIAFDHRGNPMIFYLLSKGYESGPENGLRTWMITRWDGRDWKTNQITTSDSNYDTGCMHYVNQGKIVVLGPMFEGPQPYNPGGEMGLIESDDDGKTWIVPKQLTCNSKYNHTYARKPVNVHPEFFSFWADGNPREVSASRLYYYDYKMNQVYKLPGRMESKTQPAIKLD